MADRKRCCTCGKERPLSDFNKHAASPDGLQFRCRSCFRQWYEEHATAHKINVRVRNARHRKALFAKLAEYLDSHHCVDCGESDIRCLEFDHRDRAEKKANISYLLSGSMPWARILAEIAKCDVRCANCHRKRTAAQFNNWRHQVYLRKSAVESASTLDGPRERHCPGR